MEYPVLINNKLFTIKDEANIVAGLQSDDQLLLQYVIDLIRRGKGPPISPHDINGFLNIQRVEYSENVSSDFGGCAWQEDNLPRQNTTTSTNSEDYFKDFYDLPDNSDMRLDMPDHESDNTDNPTENILPREVWCNKGKSQIDDNDATEMLMQLRSSEKYRKKFDDKKSVKLSLWKDIANEMVKGGFIVSGEKCRQKFLNLTKKYITFVRHSKQTGNDKINPPPFYELLHKILGQKDKVVLGEIRDSMIFAEVADDNDAEKNIEETIRQEASGSVSTPRKEKDISIRDEKEDEPLTQKKSVTKADIIHKIVECNDKAINSHKESIDRVMSVLSEQNTIIKDGMKQNRQQRDRLIDLFEHVVKNKKKRRHSSDSD